MLVLNQEEVDGSSTWTAASRPWPARSTALAAGEVDMPLRYVFSPAGGSTLIGLMPAHRAGDDPLYSLKTVCVFPDNPKRGLDAHQGTVTLFDGETGVVKTVMNASAITAIRTAAVSAVATRLLARKDAREARDPRGGRAGAFAPRLDACDPRLRPDRPVQPDGRACSGAGGGVRRGGGRLGGGGRARTRTSS